MMPKYQYCCEDCTSSKTKKQPFDGVSGIHDKAGEYLFIIECPIKDKPVKPKCPNCGGRNTSDNYTDYNLESWVRGNGIVNDIGGARRDMHKHTLINNDPYGHMRVSGEKDHLLDKLRKSGINMTKINSESARKSVEMSLKAKKIKYDLDDEQIKVLLIIDKNDDKCHFEKFDVIEDANKVVSSLMPDYIYKCGTDTFRMMALGKKMVEEFTEINQ